MRSGLILFTLGERRSTGEQKYCVFNFPSDASLRALAAAITAQRFREQGHQQMKEELGFDHFEGSSWTELHRHT